ncbi:sensor histidine kinase [Paremcibacter congregatus]|uniref:histidine kinase n=1 Tax=Paremcibacter congregatus TaxID=2043170 RepID=A0A2G4YWA9_9PROT|nr:HAMP domain-containing sensor histidine kinase [Paremcibacter congregatus]PHZ86627.1 histidine kinase [Paremcibacter congregatus]QDE26429.1 HAMP domain-containing histidine kinase [Paremcibacter congregatus]|tara:strand:+ start:18280 stop:19683 length:1404 start_codon:yes stop_codon:yes gene_type:complete
MVEKLKKLSIKSNLSVRLLLLTFSFVLLAEILIYVPSIANYRKSWLEERLSAANIAILAIEAAPDNMINEMMTKKLLTHAGVDAIVLKQKDKSQLVLNTDQPLEIKARYDLRDASYWTLVIDAMKTMFHVHPHNSMIQVTGSTDFTQPAQDNSYLQIIFHEDLLCEDMYAFSYNVMILSIIISLITAGLVYYSLSCLLIRPVRRLTNSVMSFRAAPEKATDDLTSDGRSDEIGIVMNEVGAMQTEIRRALTQKKHLAQLGESVSKINHDLRNILSSAQMVSDHLTTIDNPTVQKLTPRFVSALDRAVELCETTLKYGKAGIIKPILAPVDLKELVDEIALSYGIDDQPDLKFTNNIPRGFSLNADADQMYRVFMNLTRNALQAMHHRGEITITVQEENGQHVIDFSDNGPGIPDRIKATLFQPFHGSSNGGSGLGLAISREIIEAHGGTLELLQTDEKGSRFRITLP